MNNAEDSLFPPMQYDPIWFIIGIGLILVAAVFIALLLFFTKKVNPNHSLKALPQEVQGEERLSLIKTHYSGEIKELEESWRDKEISTRKAFQLLSISIRNFTHEYSGSQAFAMSLRDLEEAQAPEILAEKIRHYYPIAFEEAGRTGNFSLAAEDAQKLIMVWN